jgi:hypothetical protein
MYTVEYSPTAVGADTDSLTSDNNADGNPHTVGLSGSGVLPGVVEIAGASFGSIGGGRLNFKTLSDGVYPSTVTLSVGESTPVTFGTLAFSGSGQFSMGADNCSGSTVAPGGNCTFVINFDATGNSWQNGSVAFPHDGAGATSLDLRGR